MLHITRTIEIDPDTSAVVKAGTASLHIQTHLEVGMRIPGALHHIWHDVKRCMVYRCWKARIFP